MATTLKTRPAKYQCGPLRVVEFPEAASQTFKMFEFVEFNADGQLVINSTDDTQTLGIAYADASGTTNAMCPVLLAQNGTIFEMTLSATVDPTVALTDLGLKVGLLVANARSYAEFEETSADFLTIVGFRLDYDAAINIAGDDYVRGIVTVLPAAYQLGDMAESA